MSLVTPLDPGASPAIDVTPIAPPAANEHVHPLLFARIGCAVASACGSLHAANEDAHSALDRSGPLYVVADGVGGGALATLASRDLVAHLHATLEGRHRLTADEVSLAMLAADRLIAARIAESTRQPGAATVALCAPVNPFASRWLVAWVGDCRVYGCSADGHAVHPLTRDDTFAHLGETPAPGGSPDDPARMVGNGAVSRANVMFTELAPGERLLLCSDGVHKFIAAADWPDVLARPAPLKQQCDALVALARTHGSTDDATALMLRREPMVAHRARWLRSLVHADRTPR